MDTDASACFRHLVYHAVCQGNRFQPGYEHLRLALQRSGLLTQ